MSKYFPAAILAASLVVSGCAIRPLPEDFSGVSSYDIIRQIRCESEHALKDTTLQWLTGRSRDPEANAIGAQLKDGVISWQAFGPHLFKNPRVRNLIALFYDTGVAYHFELEGTEVNNVGASIDLLKPFTNSTFTMGIGATADRQRQNTRYFSSTDKFSVLYKLPSDYCFTESRSYLVGKNYVYPMTGQIGVERHIKDFVNMTLFAGLVTRDKESGPPTLTDQLEFETTFSNTLSPRITFAPVGTGLSVTDASLTGVAKRTDRHKLVMALSLGGPGGKLLAPIRAGYFSPLVGTVSGNSEQRAMEAVNQVLTLNLFKRIQIIAR